MHRPIHIPFPHRNLKSYPDEPTFETARDALYNPSQTTPGAKTLHITSEELHARRLRHTSRLASNPHLVPD